MPAYAIKKERKKKRIDKNRVEPKQRSCSAVAIRVSEASGVTEEVGQSSFLLQRR